MTFAVEEFDHDDEFCKNTKIPTNNHRKYWLVDRQNGHKCAWVMYGNRAITDPYYMIYLEVEEKLIKFMVDWHGNEQGANGAKVYIFKKILNVDPKDCGGFDKNYLLSLLRDALTVYTKFDASMWGDLNVVVKVEF